jgi:hypothetical protein
MMLDRDMRLSDYAERRQKDLVFKSMAEQCEQMTKGVIGAQGPKTLADYIEEETWLQEKMLHSKITQGNNHIMENTNNAKQAEQLVSVKNDQGKPRYDLLPVAPMREMAEVLEFGSRKYDANNWRSANPVPLSRHYAAVQRHLNQWWSGEDIDPESGMRHLAHAATTLLFIMELSKSRPQADDRFKGCAPYRENDS